MLGMFQDNINDDDRTGEQVVFVMFLLVIIPIMEAERVCQRVRSTLKILFQ